MAGTADSRYDVSVPAAPTPQRAFGTLPPTAMGNDKKETRAAAKSAKKPYQKPSFKHEKVFETMALACGKISATQRQCRFNRKTS